MKKIKTNNINTFGKSMVLFPTRLLMPVKNFLTDQLTKLKKTKKDMSKEDPFKSSTRTENNASPDSDAEEQYGHARVSAIKDQLNKKSSQIKKALDRIKKGKYGICEDCGNMIDTDRLAVFPEATLCVSCEKKREK